MRSIVRSVVLRFGLLLVFAGSWAGGYAQQVQFSGKVVDDAGSPLAYATIALFRGPDSSLVNGGISSESGEFSFRVDPGDYLMHIRMLAYNDGWFELDLNKPGKDAGREFTMQAEAVELDDVEITAERSTMVMKLDKRVFNVGSDLNNVSRNASELLDNVPSVSVDMDGNVALRGSENVRILIDGKPSGLVGAGDADALRNLPGSMVDKVEVITNPSARYDAEGDVGIINIVLKKEKRKGINGTFELTGGLPHNHRASYSLNLRRKRFNLFSNFGLTYRSSPGSGNSTQNFVLRDENGAIDSTFSYLSTREHRRGGWGQALTIGSDFFINPRNTITVSGLLNRSVGDNFASISYQDFNFEDVNTANSVRINEEIERERVIEGAMSYVRTFPQKGRKWTVDVKFVDNDDRETADIAQTYDLPGQDLTQRSDNTEDEQTWFFQSDYVHPFGEEGKLEMGYRGNVRVIENFFTVEEQNQGDGSWQVIEEFDNDFIYIENIQAAYLQAANQTGKWSYMGGLRAEYTDISTELLKTNETNPRDYLNLFPSAFLSYDLKKGRTVQLSYSRRISRPRFRNLLPFSSYSDNRNYRLGNPDLDPEFTHSMEAGYLHYFPKGSLLSSVYYRRTTGRIQRVTLQQDSFITYRIPINLALQNSFGLELNLSLEPLPWWKLNGNFNFFREIIEGEFEGQNFNADTYTWTGRVSSKMDIPRWFDVQLTFDYRAPQLQPQGRRAAIAFMDLGLARDILKGKGTLTFSVRDLLNSRRWRWTVEEEDYFLNSAFQWRQRQFQLSFNYRLNQEKKRGGRRGGGGPSGGGGGGF